MFDIPQNERIHFNLVTHDPAQTGLAVNADTTPAWKIYEEENDNAIAIGDFTGRTGLVGQYRGDINLAAGSGFAVGNVYSIIGTAVVAGISGNAVLKEFRVTATENFAGLQIVDVDRWKGSAMTTPNVAGRPLVDVEHWIGNAVPSPTQAGVPQVDLIRWSGSLVNSDVAGIPRIDVSRWSGTPVTTSSAGNPSVNVERWRASVIVTPNVAGRPLVDIEHWRGDAVPSPTQAGVPQVDLIRWSGSLVNSSVAGIPRVDVTRWKGTGVSDITSVGEIITGVLDEDIVTKHTNANSVGRSIATLDSISDRSNNPNLNDLLGVVDTASNDVPNQILAVETIPELATGVPPAAPTLGQSVQLPYMATRNEIIVSSGSSSLKFGDSVGGVPFKKTFQDVTGVYVESGMITGP